MINAVRYALTAALIYGVYLETGVCTATAISLMAIANEVNQKLITDLATVTEQLAKATFDRLKEL